MNPIVGQPLTVFSALGKITVEFNFQIRRVKTAESVTQFREIYPALHILGYGGYV